MGDRAALRRWHMERIKTRIRARLRRDTHTPELADDARFVGIAAHTPCRCSGWMDGNPRRYRGERTRAEQRAYQESME